MTMTPALVGFLIFLSLALPSYAIWGMPVSTEALIDKMKKRQVRPGELKIGEPLQKNPESGNAKLAGRVSKLVSVVRPKEMNLTDRSELHMKILKAGNPFNVADETEQKGLQITFCAIFAIVGALFALIFGQRILIGLAVGAGLGYALPALVLSQEIKKRERTMRKILPEALDLLSVTMSSGLNLVPALAVVAANMPDSLVKDEFQQVSRNIGSGMNVPDALEKMRQHFQSTELDSLVKSLNLSLTTGGDVVPILAKQSEWSRQSYESEIMEKAAKLEQKIMILIIFFEVPALMVMFLITPIYQMTSGGAAAAGF